MLVVVLMGGPSCKCERVWEYSRWHVRGGGRDRGGHDSDGQVWELDVWLGFAEKRGNSQRREDFRNVEVGERVFFYM